MVTPPAGLEAARRAAATLVSRHDLQPPVDIHALVRNHADVEQADWPDDDVDAIMLRRSAEKPRIFYKQFDSRGLRERFTLGHELGHILLPWQIGNQSCAIEKSFELGFSSDEDEANIFASHLLAPQQWLLSLTQTHAADMSSLLVALADAEISATATLLALKRVLTAGWAFQLNNQARPFLSTGTINPESDGPNLRIRLNRAATDRGKTELHGHDVRWWRLTEEYELPDIGDPSIPLRDLLLKAIEATTPVRHRSRVEQSANGIVGGGARDLAGRQPEEIYATLRYRFSQSPRSDLLQQPEFDKWLARKAATISTKNSS